MNLADNLKKLRKDNNLSQEQLAESLGVSRQSVSKWESGSAYPEMDKVLLLCKLFNVGVDELLNQDIKEVKEKKQSKNTMNKHIDDFLDFITKSIDMFTSMKWKDKLKLMIEEFIIVIIMCLFFIILGGCLGLLFSNIFEMFDYNKWTNFIRQILESTYAILAFAIGVILVLHIYKVRYLDYYVIIDKNKIKVDENMEENIEEQSKENNDPNNRIFLKKKEKVIIRDPDHASYRFISGLLKLFLLLIKANAFFVFGGFCISLVGFVIAFVVSFAISKAGLLFIGILLAALSCIVMNVIILYILFYFIFSRKIKWKIVFITFIGSLIIFGTGCGMGFIGFSEFKFLKDKSIESTEVISMNDHLIIPNYRVEKLKFVETDFNDIKIVAHHSNYYQLVVEKEDNFIHIYLGYKYEDTLKQFRSQLQNINKKELIDYDSYEITIYTSIENIKKLKDNYDEWMHGKNEYYHVDDEY